MMTDTPAGPVSQLADALLQVLSENLPKDLRWQWMLLMIALALGIWVMRNGHGAKGADGRERKTGLTAFLLPQDIYTHRSARVDVLLYVFERCLHPLWAGGAFLAIAPSVEGSVIGALQSVAGTGPALAPTLPWMQ